MTWLDINSTLPELIILATALLLLMLEVLSTPPRNSFIWVALAGMGLSLASVLGTPLSGNYYGNMIALSTFTRFIDVITIALVMCTFLFSAPYLRRTLEERGEYYALILFAAVGMMLMAKAHDLTMTFLGLELLSV
ncbi:MAG: hypothetical protein KAU50_00995, partial [Candidatus Marinimicrobia bacterium]|nr:hypothetical protein [Candidatus Neomarinimicrobiota bacterium]